MRRPPARAFLLGIAIGIVVALVRRAGRTPTPSPDLPALDGATPALDPPFAAAPPRATATLDAAPPTPVEGASLTPAPTVDPPADGRGAPSSPEPDGDEAGPATPTTDEPPAGNPAWAEPVDRACPDGYPVKAKEASGIFHVPGGLSYERTRPDRCYPTPEAAEADGFRPARR